MVIFKYLFFFPFHSVNSYKHLVCTRCRKYNREQDTLREAYILLEKTDHKQDFVLNQGTMYELTMWSWASVLNYLCHYFLICIRKILIAHTSEAWCGGKWMAVCSKLRAVLGEGWVFPQCWLLGTALECRLRGEGPLTFWLLPYPQCLEQCLK